MKDTTRREFLQLASVSALGTIVGCATNPVTGNLQFMLVSEEQEINIDKKRSPFQFSADYGASRDNELNKYINEVGLKIAALTHRPNIPYSFRAVNATYVNAYAFPGGSIAVTRGILLSLKNEAELAALLGHELGHVNARHSAEQMSKSILSQTLIAAGTAVLQTKDGAAGDIALQMGSLVSGAFLAYYSRSDEREADSLGMQYMVAAGYNSNGMVGLMEILQNMAKSKPNALELMFATHPMSDERYNSALESSRTTYQSSQKNPLYPERYMDKTARLRAIKDAIEELQVGESYMSKRKYYEAENHFRNALKKAPQDYAGLIMMSKCLCAQQKYSEAERYADTAKQVDPQEAQARYWLGYAALKRQKYEAAHQEFSSYERILPGNPDVIFLKGYALEGLRNIEAAAIEYRRYLQIVTEGQQAQHAYRRLVEWGYIT